MGALRDKILNAKDIKSEIVHVDEWDADVQVRGLTGAERADIIAKATVTDTNDAGESSTRVDQLVLLPLLIIATATDPSDGSQVFGDGDRDAINGKSSSGIDKVTSAALRLSGMTKDEGKAIVKNSAATASADSASA